MIIPGAGVMFLIVFMFLTQQRMCIRCLDSGLFYTVFFILSYLLGLILNTLMDVVWIPFRNNPYQIDRSRKKGELKRVSPIRFCERIGIVIKIYYFKGKRSGKCEVFHYEKLLFSVVLFLVIILCYVSGPVFLFFLFAFFLVRMNCLRCFVKSKDVISEYNKAYYYVAKKRYNDHVFILESQVSFMRNMFGLFLIAILFFQFKLVDFSCFSFFGSLELDVDLLCKIVNIVMMLLLYVINEKQNKIYNLVWEGEEFINIKQK